MKKIYVLGICIFVGLFTLLTITQFSKDNESNEIKCISEFLETYYTNEITVNTHDISDIKIFEKYMTNKAYEKFYTDRSYPYKLTGSIENIKITDIKIESIPNTDETYHTYYVSFTLSNNYNNKEKIVTNYTMNLEKEGNKWKISYNNNLYFLQKWLSETI
ncbi:MAG: hypothetical protein RSA29_00445 [Clostridium sp.]|uniref:hypothetical protein n=1 Tax=Clostridium sp. TaxID=1506 RepID=UPI003034E3F8